MCGMDEGEAGRLRKRENLRNLLSQFEQQDEIVKGLQPAALHGKGLPKLS